MPRPAEILEAGPLDGTPVPDYGPALKMPAPGPRTCVETPAGLEITFTATVYERRRGLDGRVLYVHPDLIDPD